MATSVIAEVTRRVQRLPESLQTEVLHFAEYLLAKMEAGDERSWTERSLAAALRGMEDEDPGFSEEDLKERFR